MFTWCQSPAGSGSSSISSGTWRLHHVYLVPEAGRQPVHQHQLRDLEAPPCLPGARGRHCSAGSISSGTWRLRQVNYLVPEAGRQHQLRDLEAPPG